MESKLVQTKGIGEFSSVTVCYFGSCTSAAALGTRLPSTDSYSYLWREGACPEPLRACMNRNNTLLHWKNRQSLSFATA